MSDNSNKAADSTRRDRLRVAIVTETYPPEINGVANTMRHLAEGLRARGHQIELIRPRQQGDAAPKVTAGIELCLVPGLPIPGYRGLRFGLPVYWRLRRRWNRTRPDLVYIATQGPLGHAALSAARALKLPAITGFHTQFHRYSEHYGLGLLTQPIAGTLRHFHNRSDATLVPTAELQTELSDSGFQNVHVFGRGVDVLQFSPKWRDPALRQSWGCTESDLAVLYVGRIAAEKNLNLLRDAFGAIQRERSDARLVLVGDGPELAHVQRDCPQIICPGAKVGEELSAHYASGDLFLFPSLTETFGNVVTEAMASGLAVVAFDYAAPRQYIDSGRNGLTLPMGDDQGFVDACRQLVSDDERRSQMGREARETAEGISWERVLKGVEDLLFNVIRQRSGGSYDAAIATTSE